MIELITSEDTNQKLIGYLRKEFADYGDEIFSEAMKKLSITVARSKECVRPELGKNGGPQNFPRTNTGTIVSSPNKSFHNNSTINTIGSDKIASLHFESHLEIRLKHIYGVLHFMKKGYDFSSSTNQTLRLFPEVQDYQTISDKCARGFAGSVDTFVAWFNSGEILNELKRKFSLSDYDYKIFEELLLS